MSDITNLTQKILQDAQQKQEQYLEKEEEKIEQKEKLKKNQLQKQIDENLQQFEKELRADMSLKVSDIHVKSRSEILAAKQQVLDQLYAESLQKIKAMNENEFNYFVTRNIENTPLKGAVDLVLGSDSTAFSTKENQKYWHDNATSKMELTVAEETLARRGGFLLRQGEIEYNFTFESLLNAAKEELSVELLNLIFTEE